MDRLIQFYRYLKNGYCTRLWRSLQQLVPSSPVLSGLISAIAVYVWSVYQVNRTPTSWLAGVERVVLHHLELQRQPIQVSPVNSQPMGIYTIEEVFQSLLVIGLGIAIGTVLSRLLHAPLLPTVPSTTSGQ